MSEAPAPSRTRIRVWDLPTRLVHWLLVLGFAISWWTGETGRLEWHRWSGYGLLGLMVFRIYWGFFGSSTARFRQFLPGPSSVASYLRGAWVVQPGHNPLGALSVIAMIILLVAQIVFGLFAVDVDGLESGPLSMYVSFDAGRAAAEWHEGIFEVLKWLVVLHVLAIAYYLLIKRQNLAAAMLHGTRDFETAAPPMQSATRLRFVVGLVIAVLLTWAVALGFDF
jgi:cytochrome b